jgi:hypothetical protein
VYLCALITVIFKDTFEKVSGDQNHLFSAQPILDYHWPSNRITIVELKIHLHKRGPVNKKLTCAAPMQVKMLMLTVSFGRVHGSFFIRLSPLPQNLYEFIIFQVPRRDIHGFLNENSIES